MDVNIEEVQAEVDPGAQASPPPQPDTPPGIMQKLEHEERRHRRHERLRERLRAH